MNRKQTRQGAATVEFAVTVPILLLIVFCGIELGRTSMLRHTADHAAYLAAREAIVPGADIDLVRQRAIDHLDAHGINDYVVTVSPDTITTDTTLVDVTVSFPAESNSFVIPDHYGGQLLGNCKLITERSPTTIAASLPEPPPPPAPPEPPREPESHQLPNPPEEQSADQSVQRPSLPPPPPPSL